MVPQLTDLAILCGAFGLQNISVMSALSKGPALTLRCKGRGYSNIGKMFLEKNVVRTDF